MTTSEIGENIKRIRKTIGITINDLSERIETVGGGEISPSMISMWENGKRRIYADQLYYLCLALNVSPMTIYNKDTSDEIDMRLRDEIPILEQDEKQIFYHMFYKWSGNPRALVKFLGLYMSLPKQLRMDIAGMGITMYKIGAEGNKLDKSAPPVDIEYIDTAWGKLMK